MNKLSRQKKKGTYYTFGDSASFYVFIMNSTSWEFSMYKVSRHTLAYVIYIQFLALKSLQIITDRLNPKKKKKCLSLCL